MRHIAGGQAGSCCRSPRVFFVYLGVASSYSCTWQQVWGQQGSSASSARGAPATSSCLLTFARLPAQPLHAPPIPRGTAACSRGHPGPAALAPRSTRARRQGRARCKWSPPAPAAARRAPERRRRTMHRRCPHPPCPGSTAPGCRARRCHRWRLSASRPAWAQLHHIARGGGRKLSSARGPVQHARCDQACNHPLDKGAISQQETRSTR